jgi:hypothetical protein
MTTVAPTFSLVLNEEERTQLLNLLTQVLRDTRVEEHRTEAPDYREWVIRREEILEAIISRLQILNPGNPTGSRETT